MGPVLSRNNSINKPRAKVEFLIVLAVLIAAAMAEETKVAEVTDQQVAASGYFGYGHHGLGYGHHGGYYGHPGSYYGHGYGHGHRYGRSVSDDVQGQESYYGPYGGNHGYVYRYGGYPRYGGYRYGHYYH